MNKPLRILVLAAVLLAGMAWCVGPQHAMAAPADPNAPAAPLVTTCDNFSTYPLGLVRHVGNALNLPAAGIFTSLGTFYWANGVGTNMGFLRIVNTGLAGGAGNEAWLNNITAHIKFALPTSLATINFGEYGGNINMRVNGGPLINKPNFDALHGAIIGGVSFWITNGHGHDKGRILARGPLTSLSIGGQELWIDNVCRY